MKVFYRTSDGDQGEIRADSLHMYPSLEKLYERGGGPVSIAGFNKLNGYLPDVYVTDIVDFYVVDEPPSTEKSS